MTVLIQPAPQFIADVHLGKLARLLRLLGFDTLYKNDWQKEEMLKTAESGSRVLLSRNPAFQKAAITFQQIIAERPETQLIEVLQRFDLPERLVPLTRCLLCNGELAEVSKESVTDKIPAQTANWYNQFWQCAGCGRVFWKGAHYRRIRQIIEEAERQS